MTKIQFVFEAPQYRLSKDTTWAAVPRVGDMFYAGITHGPGPEYFTIKKIIWDVNGSVTVHFAEKLIQRQADGLVEAGWDRRSGSWDIIK